MPLTEQQISTLESLCASLCTDPLCEVRRREDPRLHRLAAGTTVLIDALRASQAEARQLRAALAWYGEPRNYRVSSAASVNKIAWWPVVRDAGARARATLADDALACMSVVE
jgi:hypothetical protein